ncbi:LPD38 domain-containing protein [Aeromonas hydrophila]|uniref:LPD38 domain-containing protein n=1 Tax=Aeromonas hydrophila TaxID=644 RepID=UPI003F86DA8B
MDKPGLRDALPQPRQSDTRNDPFWSSLDSSLSAAAAATPQPSEPVAKRDLDVGLGDVARGVGAGALDLVGGIGHMARQASQYGKENAGKQGGDYLEQARANLANKISPALDIVAGAGDLAQSGADALTESMSPDAKEALGRRLVDETPEGRLTLGDGAGDIDVWAMKMAQGVGSLVPTLLAGGVTGVAAKATLGRAVTASMIKRGATQQVAEAVAAKTVSKLATGAAVTTGATGSVGSAGVNTRESVLGMSFDELSRSDTFRQAFTRIDQDQQTQHLSDEEKLSLAREETANVASRATMSDAKVWGAAAVGSMMGDAMLFKMLAGKAAAGGVLKGAAKGAAGEGISETLEEGVQQYAVNESLNEVAAADIDPMKGVMSSAIEGGLIGMGTGGAVGAVGGARGGKHASQEDGVGTGPVAEPSAPVTEDAAGPAVDPNFASVPLEDGEQAPSASQAEGELNPLGPSASQFDELRDVPAYLRRDDTAARFKGMAADSEVQRALAGEFGQSVQELVASQMQAGDQGKSLYERAQAGELGLDPFAGNKSAQQVAMENQRLALPLKDVIFAGDANAKPKGEAVAAPGDHDDQQAGPGPQFRGGERTRWQSGQEGDVLPPEASSTKPAGELPGAVIEGEAREVGNELPHRNVVYGTDGRPAQQQAANLAQRERELANQPPQIGQSDTIFAGGASGSDPRNSAYTPPKLSRDQVDGSLDTQSTRDPRSEVARSIEGAGKDTDSVFGPLKSLRITKRGKPFATEKEAAMASRKDQEMPVPLNGGGFGVAAIGEVQQAQAQQGAVKQPSSNSAQQDRQDGKTEIAQNGMVIVHGSGNPGMSEQDIQIVRASGQKQGKKGRVYGGFYGTSEQDAHQAQAYADMMGGTPTLYDVKIKPGTKVLHKQGDITRLSESYINELVSQGYGMVTGTDPRGQTEHVVIDKSAVASMAPRGAQATPSQVNDTNVADMRQPSDQPAASVSAETVPAPSATAGEASQLAPAIDTGYREVIPVKQPKTEVSNEPVTPVPAISSERSGDQPGAGDPVATSVGPTPAELAERAGPGDPADGTSLAPVPVTQPGEENSLTAPAPAGVAVSEEAQAEQARTTAGPAAAPTPWSEMIDNPDGTITLKGEVPIIKQWAKDNGVKAITGKGGLVVAKSFTAKVRGLTAPAANEPSALVEAARGGVVPEPTEVDLIDRDLLKEHAGRWKYRSAVGAGWFTSNTKEGAIDRAREAYRRAFEKGDPVPTREERWEQSEREFAGRMDNRFGGMTINELEKRHQNLGGTIADLQLAGRHEMNGNGGRRTGAAVANEGARQAGQEKMDLERYIQLRREREEMAGSAPARMIEAARSEVAPEPTEAQKEAGNYKKGHLTLQGLDIALENPKGSTRSGTDKDGKAWQSTMAHDYGYIKRTLGADGDHVDVFIGDRPDSETVYVVDQVDPKTGKFDEHKVMMGFADEQAAREGYLGNYEAGWKGLGAIKAMPVESFKRWVKGGDTMSPIAAQPVAGTVNSVRFSKQAMAQGDKPIKHLTRKEAELVSRGWFKQYRGASGVKVQIHATQGELEGALGLEAKEGLIRRAAFDDDAGTLHVAADTISDPKRMREILRHEVLAHYGLANVLGDGEYTKLMSRLIQSQKDPSMKPVWDWVNTHYADEDIGTQAEEVVAHLAEVEQGAWGRGWDRVVAWVTRALRAVGFVPDGITAAETRSLIEGLGKKLQRSGPDDSGPDGGKKFSQEAERPAQKGGIKMSQASTAADAAMEKLNLGPKPDIIDKTKASLNKLRQVDRGVVSSWIDRVIKKANTEVLDALAPIKYAEEAAGITDAADSGYVAARMATGAASTMQATMLYGLPEWNDGVIQRKAGTGEKDALLGIFADLGADLHNWLGWMAGHRAELLMAQGRENLLDANDIAELKGQGKGKEAKFLDAKARWNRLNAATLDLAQEAGLFTKEARAEFESEWYIPFFRESDDGDVIAPFKTKGIANQNAGIKKLKGGEANTNDLLENIFTSTSKLIDASMKNMAAQKTVWNLADTGIIEVIPKPNKMDYQALANGKDRIMVKLEGEDYMIRVEDPDLYRAMTFFDRKPFGAMVNVAAKAKRLLTAGVTASPEFMLRNFLRDSLSSWAISKDGFRPVIDSIKGVKKTLAMDGSTIDVMFSGASFLGGYVNGNDPEAMADTVRKSLRRKGMTPEQIARYEKSIIRNAAQAKGVVANVWEKYNRYGEAFENANREAVYAAAIKAGKSHAQAAFESKDLMDFSMLGASRTMQVMTQLLPFFNARVQGLGKLTRELRDNPIAIAKRAGMITAASLALLAANWDDERYEELPDWDKDANWHFFVGDQHFRIPKPFEIGVLFGTIPERMVRAMGDKDTGAQLGKAVARAIGDTFALNPTPQIVKPLVEAAFNYDTFRGGPIDGPQDLNVQAEARYNEQTSLLMRELGELTGFSPKQLEHLVIGYTGTMGSYVMAAADGLIRAARPGESASWRADEIPLVKAVYRGTGPAKSTQHMEEFYRMLNEVNQLKRTVDQYRSEGLTDKASELLEEQGGILKSRRSLSRTQQQVRVVRNKIELIQRDRTLSAEEKRRRIDELLARRNDLVYQAVNKNKANWE